MLELLPEELVENILTYCEFCDIRNLSACCRTYSNGLQSILWRFLKIPSNEMSADHVDIFASERMKHTYQIHLYGVKFQTTTLRRKFIPNCKKMVSCKPRAIIFTDIPIRYVLPTLENVLSNLWELKLHNTSDCYYRYNDHFFAEICNHLKNLTHLCITHSTVNEKGLFNLHKLTALKRLKLHSQNLSCWMENEGFSYICDLKHLTVLNLHGLHPITLYTWSLLPSNLSSLKELVLHKASISEEACPFISNLKMLDVLDVSGCYSLTDASASLLSKVVSLRKLNLSGNVITDSCIPDLVHLKNLRVLFLSKTQITDATLDDLFGFEFLNVLNISHTGITCMGVKYQLTKGSWRGPKTVYALRQKILGTPCLVLHAPGISLTRIDKECSFEGFVPPGIYV